MTMLTRKNWNGTDRWYEMPVDITEEELAELDDSETYVAGGYRRVSWWDRYSKLWISYIVNGEDHQMGSADFAANKRTFEF